MSFLKKKKGEYVAILDIGSSSIGGAIVLIEEDELPVILCSVRRQIKINNDINFSRFFANMSEVLESVLQELSKNTKIFPEKTFCILSSFWYSSATYFIKIEKKSSFIITHKMIDDLVNEKVSIVNKDVENKKNITSGVSSVIDAQNIQIKLNGYETNNPYNKKAKLVEVALFISIGSKKTIKLIESKVSRIFNNNVYFSSFSLASFVVIRDIFAENNFLFLDITGEVTDVSIVKNNTLFKNASFPLGKNFLIRRIASGLDTSVEEAESLLSIFNADNSNLDTNDKFKKILDDAKQEWGASFIKVLQSFSRNLSIPNSIFITIDDDIQSWFIDIIKNEEFDKFTFMNDKFEIRILDDKLITKFHLLKKDNVARDLFIMLDILFVERIVHPKL